MLGKNSNQVSPIIVAGYRSLRFRILGGHTERSPNSYQSYIVLQFGVTLQHIVKQFLQADGIGSEICYVER